MKLQQVAGMNQNYRQYSYEYFLESMRIAGYENIELWLGAPHIWIDSRGRWEIKKIAKQTKKAGLNIVSVTTPSGGAFQYQYASQEKYHKERSISYFINGVITTAELGASIMTVNTGWGYWCDKESHAREKAIEILSTVCEVACREGITIAIESLTKDESLIGYNIQQISNIIKAIGSPVLKVMIDLSAIAFSKESSQLWFDTFGKDIIHFHFQDGDKSTPSDAHLPWGTGNFDLDSEIKCLEKNGYCGILTQEIYGSQNPREDDMKNMMALSQYLSDRGG